MPDIWWNDTSHVSHPPNDSPDQAVWLLGRHPQLATLVARTGLARTDARNPGRPFFDLDILAAALLNPHEVDRQWPDWESRLDASIQRAADRIGPMSSGEVRMLR